MTAEWLPVQHSVAPRGGYADFGPPDLAPCFEPQASRRAGRPEGDRVDHECIVFGVPGCRAAMIRAKAPLSLQRFQRLHRVCDGSHSPERIAQPQVIAIHKDYFP